MLVMLLGVLGRPRMRCALLFGGWSGRWILWLLRQQGLLQVASQTQGGRCHAQAHPPVQWFVVWCQRLCVASQKQQHQLEPGVPEHRLWSHLEWE